MPAFALDRLDPSRTGGDLLLQICAGQRDTVVHAVRELMRVMAGTFTPRWSLDGFQAAQRNANPHASTRNLFAFRDGTANPDVTDEALMRRARSGSPTPESPPWATGGTYMVVRTIRQHVEFWDRVGMLEQEQMIGRYRVVRRAAGRRHRVREPGLSVGPEGQADPAQRPYPAGQPAHAADRRPADPAPSLQLQPRLRRGRRPGSGAPVRRLQPGPRAPVRHDPAAARSRADDRLHHPGRGRLFLRPARRLGSGRLGRVGAGTDLSAAGSVAPWHNARTTPPGRSAGST